METWFIILISFGIAALFNFFLSPTTKLNLPPGPATIPMLGNFLWLRKSFADLEPVLRHFHAKYGPMVTLRIGSRASIFISDRSIAHHALIQNGSLFSERPSVLPTGKLTTSNQHSISSASYGPTWRMLRRNLTSEILNPSRVKAYAAARKWVLKILIRRLESQSKSGNSVRIIDNLHYAMFCLLVFMCFGEKVNENQLKDIETVQRKLLLSIGRFNILNFLPSIGKIVFKKRWEELFKLRKNQEDVLIPLIRSRKQLMREKLSKSKEDNQSNEDYFVLSYVDTLLALELPDENRKLNEGEMVTLCSEFLNAGTDTTSTALHWIMTNVVELNS